MSQAPSPEHAARMTIASIARLFADGERIAMLTAYDYPTARILDEAGIPMLLVGDSLGQVMLGYDSTVRVTMAEMLHHTKAVVRGTKRALVVADMPFLSYGVTPEASLENAGVMMREGGAGAVKLEGGERSARTIEIDRSGRHPGHGPHRPYASIDPPAGRSSSPGQDTGRRPPAPGRRPGGPAGRRLRGCPRAGARTAGRRDHRATAHPDDRHRRGSRLLGPGPGDHGSARLSADFTPRHARHYAELHAIIKAAAEAYGEDVRAGAFPGPEQSTRMDDRTLDEILGRTALDRADGMAAAHGIPLDRDL